MAIIIDGTTGITGVPAIGSAAANTAVTMNDSGSNSNTCRAWVNFNGTGTIAIRASFNVTSITDNGVGDYTVNFTNAMPDANYSVGGSIKYNTSTTSGTDMRFEIKSSTAMTASAFTVVCSNYTGTLADMNTVVLNVFR
jgi:hypothetical protein